MKTIIYYFTATGNSLDIARDIADKVEDVELVSIAQLQSDEKIIPKAEKIGIIFPVYDWSAPFFVRDFIKRLDLTKVKYIFSVTNCNYIPGMALDRINDELKQKGKILSAGFFIRMPGNYIALYGANSDKTQKKKLDKKAKKINKIAAIVNENQIYGIEKSKVFFARLFASSMEKQMNDFHQMDKNFWTDEKCNGCGICKSLCAFENIEMIDKKPKWLHRCEQCFACIHLCPKEAIQYGNKTKSRKRYKNPCVTLQDIVKANKK